MTIVWHDRIGDDRLFVSVEYPIRNRLSLRNRTAQYGNGQRTTRGCGGHKTRPIKHRSLAALAPPQAQPRHTTGKKKPPYPVIFLAFMGGFWLFSGLFSTQYRPLTPCIAAQETTCQPPKPSSSIWPGKRKERLPGDKRSRVNWC